MSSEDEAERIAEVYRGYREEHREERWSAANPGNRALVAQRRRAATALLGRHGLGRLAGRRVLDIGSGFGAELAALAELGATPEDLHGVDLLPDRVEAAQRAHPGIDFRVANAEKLPYRDAEFDLALAFTLFSSILDRAVAARVAAEVARVLKPGGALLWYDLRIGNPRNPNVRGLGAGELQALFPGFRQDVSSIGLLPPLARRLGPLTAVAYPLLAFLPPLRSHLIGVLEKDSARS